MTQVISSSGHDDMIHDAVLDYYGRRLATCSSDKTIKIFEIDGDQHRLVETLKGHEGAVWCISWAHPKYGSILASSSYDGRILIWREQNSTWQRIYEFTLHTASVNLIAWSPAEIGCHLAAASSDGNVSVLTFENNTFSHVIFGAHGALGANAVSWAPAAAPGALISAAQGPGGGQGGPVRRFVTGGSDNLVKIWNFNTATGSYENMCTLTGHTDWVRDVAWSPTPLSKSYIASASQDHTVRIYTLPASGDMSDPKAWHCETLDFEVVVWRVSWSMAGNVLAVSGGDNRVSLWKEKLKGGWECVKTIEE